MKKPKKPPPFSELLDDLREMGDSEQRTFIVEMIGKHRPDGYLHWDKLLRYSSPEGLTHRQWWFVTKFNRQSNRNSVSLVDNRDETFSFVLPDPIAEQLHIIDKRASAWSDPNKDHHSKERYLVHSLVEEAITSSQLEGAAVTREVAREMIRTKRRPHDVHEQMILNNYHTMQYIAKIRHEKISLDLILKIHRMVTEGTMDDPSAVGRFRREDEQIDIGDPNYGDVYHVPPPAGQLEDRIQAMCDFANSESPDYYIHPVIRSIILHFWLAYDHPFKDGNGRTARALFYWSMLQHDYWLFEYVSISEIIRKAPAKYGRAFLYTETDDNDLTYFILYHLNVLIRALDQVRDYIERKTKELKELEEELQGMATLNHRQRALISHALRNPRHEYTIYSHGNSHNVVHQTARTDLNNLVERSLLSKTKIDRVWFYKPTPDLSEKLRT